MRLTSRNFWIKAALVAGAILLPFGSVILLVAAVKRAQRNRRAANPTNELEEWWKLRALERASTQSWHRNGDRPVAVPVRVRH